MEDNTDFLWNWIVNRVEVKGAGTGAASSRSEGDQFCFREYRQSLEAVFSQGHSNKLLPLRDVETKAARANTQSGECLHSPSMVIKGGTPPEALS